MLTLTRREGESIVIGDTIRVTVKSVRGRHARLMISAPAGIPIYREEVYQAIEEENRAAAASRALLPAQLSRVAVRLDTGAAPRVEGDGSRRVAEKSSGRTGSSPGRGSKKEGES